MSELVLDVSPDRLTVDDLIMLEEREAVTMRVVRGLLARYVVGGDGEVVDYDDALALVGALSLTELRDVLERLGGVIGEVKEQAVSGEASGN